MCCTFVLSSSLASTPLSFPFLSSFFLLSLNLHSFPLPLLYSTLPTSSPSLWTPPLSLIDSSRIRSQTPICISSCLTPLDRLRPNSNDLFSLSLSLSRFSLLPFLLTRLLCLLSHSLPDGHLSFCSSDFRPGDFGAILSFLSSAFFGWSGEELENVFCFSVFCWLFVHSVRCTVEIKG